MSRIGKKVVSVPAGVTVQSAAEHHLVVKGPKGELRMKLRPEIEVALDTGNVRVNVVGSSDERELRAFHGMTRALINNMVQGVTQGFEKKLEIIGVGWNAAAQGNKVVLNIGYNKPVTVEMPKDVKVQTPNPTSIIINGPDKQAVGHIAAFIRKKRPPEPYKGKGIRYVGEVVQKKAGKTFGS